MNGKALILSSELLKQLSICWKLPKHYWRDVQLQWSPRLRKSLGIAYPAKRLARFNCLLKKDEFSCLLEEVVCHELAHLVAYDREKNTHSVHNAIWKELMNQAGYEPRLGLSITDIEPVTIKRNEVLYIHSCPVCHESRSSLKPNSSWKCIGCENAGLDGKLKIMSQPISRGSRQ